MKKTTENTLSSDMQSLLQGQTLVLLHMYDAELGKNLSNALSWVFAKDEQTIRFAVDHKSRIAELAQNGAQITLTLFANEKVYTIYGEAKVKKEKTEDITLKMALLEVSIHEIRDITFYGAKMVQNPQFVKTYNEDLAKKLDREIEEALCSL